MANKVDRVLESINDKCGKDIYNDLIAKVGMIDEKPTVKKQAMYLESLLVGLNNFLQQYFKRK